MTKVVLEGVVKKFGPVTAVDGLTIEIADREFVTLVGPSGCGKTPTLRMIAGLEKVTAGQIYFDDDPVGHLPANHRDIAMVFQSYALYPHMNVYENIGFALRMMRVPRPEIERRVQWAADMLVSPTCSTASRASSRAASASASRSAAPWCANRLASCSTSHCPISTRS